MIVYEIYITTEKSSVPLNSENNNIIRQSSKYYVSIIYYVIFKQ